MNMSSFCSRKVAWMVWIVASLFYAYQYILRVMPSIMLEDIISRFHIDAATFGQFSGVYYIGYSLMHLPIGIALDRWGPRYVISGCILLTVLGTLPLFFESHWAWPVAGRFLVGLGSSAAILGVFKVIRLAFSETRFPRMLSFSVTIGLIGAIYGGGPVSYLRDTLGYHTVIQLLAIGGVVLALFTYFLIPQVTCISSSSVLEDVKEVLTNRKFIQICLFSGCMVGPLEGFADVWATSFLKQVYGMEATYAASIPSMIFIGMCFGGPLLNFIAERIRSYLMTVIASGLVMMVSFSAMAFFNLQAVFIPALFIVIGICCAYQILAIYKASTYARKEVAGLTTSLANMIIMLFGYLFHTVIGVSVDYFGGPFNSQALVSAIAIIPCTLALGVLGCLRLRKYESKEAYND
jgi:predicted MFS family arabinose efflux permease